MNLRVDTGECIPLRVAAGYTNLMRNRQNIVTMTATVAGVLALSGGCVWPASPTRLSNSSGTTAVFEIQAGVSACHVNWSQFGLSVPADQWEPRAGSSGAGTVSPRPG